MDPFDFGELVLRAPVVAGIQLVCSGVQISGTQ